jgi:glyoxylase I family protein
MDELGPLTHIALTVRDLSISIPWYAAVFEAVRVVDADTDRNLHDTVYVFGHDSVVGLHQHGTGAPPVGFNEFRVGLDHVALRCADLDELEKRAIRLEELDLARGVIADRPYGAGLAFRDPDGIALEFFAPAS